PLAGDGEDTPPDRAVLAGAGRLPASRRLLTPTIVPAIPWRTVPMNRHSAPAAAASPAAPDGFTRPNGLPAVPIVLGVVGHRDVRPEDREILKQELKKVFQQFRDEYPHTPLVLLSALAEGADQLAAEAALECECGVFVR